MKGQLQFGGTACPAATPNIEINWPPLMGLRCLALLYRQQLAITLSKTSYSLGPTFFPLYRVLLIFSTSALFRVDVNMAVSTASIPITIRGRYLWRGDQRVRY